MDDQPYFVVIIGSGPAGLSAAAHAAKLGLHHILLEAQPHLSNTIHKYQKGKHVMAEPGFLDLRSPLSFQAGTRDEVSDRDGDGVIDAIQDTLELIAELSAAGCEPEQITYVEVPGGRHDFETWARVLPVFLEWAFSPGQGRQTAARSSGSLPPP